jgi:hypothetical protein
VRRNGRWLNGWLALGLAAGFVIGYLLELPMRRVAATRI